MYLKEITAQGFKSFADKISIELSNNITGIVGPNGSGKSNVVDAVRWVLGEQSVKSLRGEGSMTDVIFNGSDSRNKQNVASVTLVFENSDHYLPIGYNEVAIRRRVYRDGTNEYFINNERCRLKDITDLFLDSGIAKESFNIISQGEVEKILSYKPTERRVMFEEAAGVLKYKKRKEEALRKLNRTHDNLDRATDIINELETQVAPLKEQKNQAEKYLDIKTKLDDLEVALIAADITNINQIHQEKKARIAELEVIISDLSINNSNNEVKLTKLKNEVSNIELQLNEKNRELLVLTTNAEKLNSRKNIVLERQKYQVEDTKLHQNLVDATERLHKLKNDFETTRKTIEIKENEQNAKMRGHNDLINQLASVKSERGKYESNLTNAVRKTASLKNRIEILKDNIENNELLPRPVKKVLDNPKLYGIHNVIGNLIEVPDEYRTAIATTLGASASNIIVENENAAKEAISFLKENNLGRATFFPLNIIKGRLINQGEINGLPGLIGIASNLIKYNQKYLEIMQNQLGNVLVIDNLDNANRASKIINHRYRIVTLDGQVLHVGGSLTGGANQSTRNMITLKHELESLISEYDREVKKQSRDEDDINIIDNKIKALEDKIYLSNKEMMTIKDEIGIRRRATSDLTNLIGEQEHEITSINNMLKNTLSTEEEQIMNDYYKALQDKENLITLIADLNNKHQEARNNLETSEHSLKSENTKYNTITKELNNLQIEVNRSDVKLDNLLNSLSENYNMTYEFALREHHLEGEIDVARNTVNNYKKSLKEIGMVNINAIEEYDRVSERYEFLTTQKNDLLKAEATLLEIINEMDGIMKNDFQKTFEIIQANFTKTFKELFRGGHAELKMTDPDNILETGIEIIACPPGKKLEYLSFLSGGEKAFTAVSLLFAILKSRPVPFCVLDEVEAPLDDANVDSFGEYLKQLAVETQFILITHKKRTMEYVDNLYGITMQESGVSKLVSVKLSELSLEK